MEVQDVMHGIEELTMSSGLYSTAPRNGSSLEEKPYPSALAYRKMLEFVKCYHVLESKRLEACSS